MDQLTDRLHTERGAMWPFLKRMIGYLFQYKKWMYSFLFWILVTAIVEAIFPLIVLNLIDNVLTPQLQLMYDAKQGGTVYTPDLSMVYPYVLFILLVGLIQAFSVYCFVLACGKVNEHVMYNIREQLFRKLQQLSFSFYDRSASGWLLTRMTSDTDRVTQVISWGLLDAFWGITTIFFCQIVILFYNWKLGLIIFVSIPVLLVVSIKIRMLVLQYSREARKINSDLTANFSEHINGVKINKSTSQEERVSHDFRQLSGRMYRSSFRASYYTAMYVPLVVFISAVTSAFIIYFGGNMTIAIPAGITVGVLTASFDYGLKIFMPIIDISLFYAAVQGSLSAGERIFSLLDEPLKIKDQEGIDAYENIKGALEFKGVSFHYNPENPVMQDFNLKITPGTSVALVGATGEGKTTIVNLVARFYEPVAGELLIDGVDYRTKTLESLRSRIGMVLQTPHLFNGTIEENIRFGRKQSTKLDILNALKLVGAGHFAGRLEEQVGEGGEHLSMGERQLVSFARAVLTDPSIFIMDEATSSIDTIAEAQIQLGVEQMLTNRTAIVIAHRLSTIATCDRILVIKGGQIAEDGSHKELLALKGKYYDLYRHQLREERMKSVET